MRWEECSNVPIVRNPVHRSDVTATDYNPNQTDSCVWRHGYVWEIEIIRRLCSFNLATRRTSWKDYTSRDERDSRNDLNRNTHRCLPLQIGNAQLRITPHGEA